MSALYERSQLTQVMISSAPAAAETMDKAEYLRLDCTIKEVQFTAGQKQDIDVTTLCSTEQENINGLGASSEISMSCNQVNHLIPTRVLVKGGEITCKMLK